MVVPVTACTHGVASEHTFIDLEASALHAQDAASGLAAICSCIRREGQDCPSGAASTTSRLAREDLLEEAVMPRPPAAVKTQPQAVVT